LSRRSWSISSPEAGAAPRSLLLALLAGLLALAVGLAGCGYSLVGGVTNVPAGAKTIAIPVFVNRTPEAGIETDFTNSLVLEFNRSRVLEVVAPPGDLTLAGAIEGILVQPVAYNKQIIAVERRVYLRLSARLTSGATGAVLWQDRNIPDNEVFVVDPDPQVTEQNRREAIRRIAERVAFQIHNRALEGF
jgi:outer membrane lipopolysaccharide assembly protein LptE/RlpB